jgi:hypothetical protein
MGQFSMIIMPPTGSVLSDIQQPDQASSERRIGGSAQKSATARERRNAASRELSIRCSGQEMAFGSRASRRLYGWAKGKHCSAGSPSTAQICHLGASLTQEVRNANILKLLKYMAFYCPSNRNPRSEASENEHLSLFRVLRSKREI